MLRLGGAPTRRVRDLASHALICRDPRAQVDEQSFGHRLLAAYACCVPALVSPVLRGGVLCGQTQPTLTAGDIEIRPWSQHDAQVLVEAYSDPDIQRWHVRTMDAKEAREWVTARAQRWKAELGADWIVTRAGTGSDGSASEQWT